MDTITQFSNNASSSYMLYFQCRQCLWLKFRCTYNNIEWCVYFATTVLQAADCRPQQLPSSLQDRMKLLLSFVYRDTTEIPMLLLLQNINISLLLLLLLLSILFNFIRPIACRSLLRWQRLTPLRATLLVTWPILANSALVGRLLLHIAD